MVCIYCGSATSVINSRPQKRANNIWRRRQCVGCKAVFTSSESPDLLKGLSVKTANQLQPFSRDKLFLSIHDSLKHRQTATNDATALTITVISHVYPQISNGFIDRDEIVQASLAILKRFDKPAATHYSAFHRLD